MGINGLGLDPSADNLGDLVLQLGQSPNRSLTTGAARIGRYVADSGFSFWSVLWPIRTSPNFGVPSGLPVRTKL